EAAIERADIAHPKTERAAIGIEAPYADHDFVFDIALEARAVEQDALVLGCGLHRLPGDRGRRAQLLDLGCRPPARIAAEQRELLFVRAFGARGNLQRRQTLGPQFLDNISHAPSTRVGQAASPASLAGSPAMRLCHITRGWVMSQGVARCSRHRLSHSTASPGAQS